jgi:acetoacetyl-CoA reductase
MTGGRVAIVTGGTRGIGRAISLALGASGAHVAATYASNTEAAKAFAEEAGQLGMSLTIHQGDVGSPDDCANAANEVVEQHGHIDYLINNAGIAIDRTVRRMTIDEWHAVMRINISGAFYMVKAVVEHLIERGNGRIVNVSSVIGQMGNVGQANYATAKSGMFGLTKTLALELANKGITVNCVSPGFIDTDMLGSVPPEVLERMIGRIPVRRLGLPEEVAHAVMFLLDDASSYITGAVIPINGGLDM